MQYNTSFQESATITLQDGSILELDSNDFTIGGNTVISGYGATTLPLGAAVGRTITIKLVNGDERFSQYDFFGAKINLRLSYPLSETVESLDFGTFTVITPQDSGSVISISASDNIYKTDKPFFTNIPFPATASNLLIDVCNSCGIELYSSSFRNSDLLIRESPSGDLTFRQVIGYIAMLAVGNAVVDRDGKLKILEYDFSLLRAPENTLRHNFNAFITLTQENSDISITGFKLGNYQIGNEGYIISVENPILAGLEDAFLSSVSEALLNIPLRKFSGRKFSDPTIEFMDLVKITDRKGNEAYSFITDSQFSFYSSTEISCNLESPLQNSQSYTAPENKVLIEAKKLIEEETTARENALKGLNEKLDTSSGMYETTEQQDDGSDIIFLHDKPTLNESKNIIRVTSEAIGFSIDGGNSYPYGVTLDGTTITRILYAEGLNADYMNVGTIRSNDGSSFWDLVNNIFQLAAGAVRIDSSGVNVKVAEEEMETNITGRGMSITKDGETTLTADHKGVGAKDLRATTYLIVGANSRFEDYGEGRTGCFFIGGNA